MEQDGDLRDEGFGVGGAGLVGVLEVGGLGVEVLQAEVEVHTLLEHRHPRALREGARRGDVQHGLGGPLGGGRGGRGRLRGNGGGRGGGRGAGGGLGGGETGGDEARAVHERVVRVGGHRGRGSRGGRSGRRARGGEAGGHEAGAVHEGVLDDTVVRAGLGADHGNGAARARRKAVADREGRRRGFARVRRVSSSSGGATSSRGRLDGDRKGRRAAGRTFGAGLGRGCAWREARAQTRRSSRACSFAASARRGVAPSAAAGEPEPRTIPPDIATSRQDPGTEVSRRSADSLERVEARIPFKFDRLHR